MQTTLVTVSPEATVAEAAELMSIHHVGAALIVRDHALAGIFTERDIVRALAAEHDAAGHAVTGWMTTEPVAMPPEATAMEALQTMIDSGFRHIPVVEGGRLIGIVSLRDLSGRLL